MNNRLFVHKVCNTYLHCENRTLLNIKIVPLQFALVVEYCVNVFWVIQILGNARILLK